MAREEKESFFRNDSARPCAHWHRTLDELLGCCMKNGALNLEFLEAHTRRSRVLRILSDEPLPFGM